MKVLVILAVLAVANANILTDFGHTISEEFKQIKDVIKPVAAQLGQVALQQLKEAGGKIVSNLLSSLATFGAASSKREVRDVASFIANGEHMLENLGHKANAIFQKGMEKLSDIADKVHNLKIFGAPLENIIKEIDSVVESHGRLQLANIADVMGNLLHKRSAFSDLGGVVKTLFNTFHDTVKNFASSLKEAIQPHIDTMKQVVSSVVQQGKDTVSALKAAAKDILAQTTQNAAPAIQKLGETGKDAISVIGQHLIQNLLG